jgi:hypothetical protein
MPLIFVHIPKAAGTSLKNAIVEKAGASAVVFKYDKPMADGRATRRLKCLAAALRGEAPQAPITFGHFLVGKFCRPTPGGFAPRPGLRYATFLREPLQRAVSHYHFWKRTHLGGHRVWERFTRENWSLERFLLGREHQDFQSQFLWGFSLDSFDFVGIAEHYEESVALLYQVFPDLAGLAIRAENANPEKRIGGGYAVDPTLAEEFRRRNARDYVLYEEALARFEAMRQRFAALVVRP